MFRLIQYYQRFDGARSRFGRLPGWARILLFVAALPGIILIGLSILAFVVSLLALLLLTVPLYRVLSALLIRPGPDQNWEPASPEGFEAMTPPTPRRHVDVKIVE